MVYIIEPSNWSINMDGEQLVKELNAQKLLKSRTSSGVRGLKNTIIHFGSINTIVNSRGVVHCDKSNKIILTWFHVLDDDPRKKYIATLLQCVDIFHTASSGTKHSLVKIGIPSKKIIVIPLGVDTNHFRPVDNLNKASIRQGLKIPNNKLIIGSFQKDGVGWGRGDEPKLIKGPDILCNVIERLSRQLNIHVLLTGPARGYVINRLITAGISYTHSYLKNYLDIVKYYQALDMYLVTSRIEGGPKAILEAWATGIPVVTTRVGMVDDICSDNNCAITEINDEVALCRQTLDLLVSRVKIAKLRQGGLRAVMEFDWSKIAQNYYSQIYSRFMHA